MNEHLTFDELMALAKQEYNRGGDATYECWDEKAFNDYVEMFGPFTKEKALEMFRIDYGRELDAGWC